MFLDRYGPDLRQCTAQSKQTGDRCGQAAIKGGTICPWHGGSAPQVKARANLRLLELVEPSLHRLASIVDSTKSLDADAIRAANSLLDRAGVVRRTDIDPAAAQALLLERLREIQAGRVVQGEVIPDALEP